VGFGYLAALVMRLSALPAGQWIALSRREPMRRLARDMGAAAAYDYQQVPSERWDSFDVVIEAAGTQQTLDFATWLTAQGGRLVVAGYHADGPRTVNMQSWNWKGIDVINAHERDPCVSMRRMAGALRLLEERGIAPDELISHRWPLADAGEAFAAADEHPAGYVKGVIEP
jgi:threonine dehydrogenase-like Zn-dependent dehydrogenase